MEKEKFLKRSVVENDIMCQTTNGKETVSINGNADGEKDYVQNMLQITQGERRLLDYSGW